MKPILFCEKTHSVLKRKYSEKLYLKKNGHLIDNICVVLCKYALQQTIPTSVGTNLCTHPFNRILSFVYTYVLIMRISYKDSSRENIRF